MQTALSETAELQKAMVVSIHDVSPWTESTVDRILDQLAGIGVGKTSLLVVPNYHRRGRFTGSERFCQWLRHRAAHGHEPVLHGYEHLRSQSSEDGFFKRLVTERYTAGEGEFLDLSREAALEKLRKGMDCFEEIGLHPRGFIAPAWLLGEEARRAVGEMGFDYAVTLREFIPLDGSEPTSSQSMVYSVRSGWRRTVSLGWNELLFRTKGTAELLRVSIHPVDIRHDRIWEHTLNSIRRALVYREAIPYEGWLERLIRSR